MRRAARRGLPADAGDGDARAMAARGRAPDRCGDRVGECGQLLLRFTGGENHGASPSRPTAIGRLSRALCALEVDGLETNRELLGAILDRPRFRRRGRRDRLPRPAGRSAPRALGDAVRRRHVAAAGFASCSNAAAASLVPRSRRRMAQRGGGAHVDVFVDRWGVAVRAGGPDDPVAVLVRWSEWMEVGTASEAVERQGVHRRPHLGGVPSGATGCA